MADDAPPRGTGRTLVTLLAAVAAVLAVTVAWLVWRGTDEPPCCPQVDVKAIAEAVSIRLEEDGYLKQSHFDRRTDDLDAAVSLLLTAEEFRAAIAGLKRACCAGPSGAPPVSRIWVVFDNAQLDEEDATGTDPLNRLTESSHGIAISEAQRERLDGLARALDACATPDRPVRLKIQGFSSTREFVGEGGIALPDSESLNLKAANLRAANVSDHLDPPGEGSDTESNVKVSHVRWTSYADIRRPFLDAPEGIDSTEQELLNRSVLVEIEDAGACAVEAAGKGSGG